MEWILKRLLNNPKEIAKMREKAALAVPGHSTKGIVENIFQLTMTPKKAQKIG